MAMLQTSVLFTAVVTVAALYFAREVLIPLALALLLSFLLTPAARFLQRFRTPKPVAIAAVVLLAFAILFSLGTLIATQITSLAGDLPRYESTLREKARSLRAMTGGASSFGRAAEVIGALRKEIEAPNGNEGAASKAAPVIVTKPDTWSFESMLDIATPFLHPLTSAGLVFLFSIFILAQREDLRSRLIVLAGTRDLSRTTAALDDAGERLSRLFLTQLALNATFGLIIGVGLYLIGVPSAALWGVIAMVLRFVPYIGAVLAAVLPMLVAAAVGPGWTMFAHTGLLFLLTEPIFGHMLEPLVLGHSTGLTPAAVVFSATFWTWIWGPVGLLLSTPLTICLVVAGRHIEALRFLEVMFGEKSPLTPPQLVYQRLLARDPIEVEQHARTHVKETNLGAYYNDVLLPALALARSDAEEGHLPVEAAEAIHDGVGELVDELSTQAATARAKAREGDEPVLPDDAGLRRLSQIEAEGVAREAGLLLRKPNAVLCVGGRDRIDNSGATIVASALRTHAVDVRVETADALSVSRFFSLDFAGAIVVCVCFVDRPSPAQAGYIARRIRRRTDARIILAILAPSGEAGETVEEDLALTKVGLVDVTEAVLAVDPSSAEPREEPAESAKGEKPGIAPPVPAIAASEAIP